jgi:hypothetical protein
MTSEKLFHRRSGRSYTDVMGETVEPRVLIHLCTYPGCMAWGSFLFGARWKDGVPGDARCRDHVLYVNGLVEPLPHPPPAPPEEKDDAAIDEAGPGDPEPHMGP